MFLKHLVRLAHLVHLAHLVWREFQICYEMIERDSIRIRESYY